MPRKNTAMAKAATCPSVTEPSAQARDHESDLVGGQRVPVALLADDLLGQHRPDGQARRRSRRSGG